MVLKRPKTPNDILTMLTNLELERQVNLSPSLHNVKVLSDHIQQDIFLALQTGDCLLLHESSAESSCMSFLHYFHSAMSNHLSIAISLSF